MKQNTYYSIWLKYIIIICGKHVVDLEYSKRFHVSSALNSYAI